MPDPGAPVPSDDDADAAALADVYLLRLRTAVADGDLAAAAAAARDGWYEILTQRGREARLTLEAAPASELKEHPLLLIMLGLTYNARLLRRARALRYFAAAVVAARRDGSNELPTFDRALIRTGEAAALRLLGRPSLGAGPARLAIKLLDELGAAERETARNVSRLYAQAGMTLYYAEFTAEAMDAFTKGVAEAPDDARVEGFGSMSMLSGIHARDGDLGEAAVYVELARADDSFAAERASYTGTFYRVAEAILALEQFDAAAAGRHLSQAAPNRRAAEHWIAVAEAEALVALVGGRAAEGSAALEEAVNMRGAEARSSRTRQQLSRVRGLLQLALGDVDAAAIIAHRDARSGAGAFIDRARVALVRGQAGTALNELRTIAGSPLSPRRSAEAMALEVAVLTRYPATPRVDALARRLGAHLARTGLRLPLAFLPADALARVAGELSRVGYGDIAAAVPGSVLLDAPPTVALTPRELAVLVALPHSASMSELATTLGVSTNTVKTQVRSLYRKLGVTGREDAIAVALDRHLISHRVDGRAVERAENAART